MLGKVIWGAAVQACDFFSDVYVVYTWHQRGSSSLFTIAVCFITVSMVGALLALAFSRDSSMSFNDLDRRVKWLAMACVPLNLHILVVGLNAADASRRSRERATETYMERLRKCSADDPDKQQQARAQYENEVKRSEALYSGFTVLKVGESALEALPLAVLTAASLLYDSTGSTNWVEVSSLALSWLSMSFGLANLMFDTSNHGADMTPRQKLLVFAYYALDLGLALAALSHLFGCEALPEWVRFALIGGLFFGVPYVLALHVMWCQRHDADSSGERLTLALMPLAFTALDVTPAYYGKAVCAHKLTSAWTPVCRKAKLVVSTLFDSTLVVLK